MPHNEIPVNHDRSWQDVSLWKKKENRFHVVYEKNDLRYECNVNYDLTVWARPLFITLQFYITR